MEETGLKLIEWEINQNYYGDYKKIIDYKKTCERINNYSKENNIKILNFSIVEAGIIILYIKKKEE